METLHIEGTANTVDVLLDAKTHQLMIGGESRPENIKLFFEPVFKWVANYCSYVFYITNEYRKPVNITVNFKMEYFNSSTVKIFLKMLLELKKLKEQNALVSLVINWYYEEGDIDMKDAGEEFADLAEMEIKLIEC